jgi:hypothetical protein
MPSQIRHLRERSFAWVASADRARCYWYLLSVSRSSSRMSNSAQESLFSSSTLSWSVLLSRAWTEGRCDEGCASLAELLAELDPAVISLELRRCCVNSTSRVEFCVKDDDALRDVTEWGEVHLGREDIHVIVLAKEICL